MPQWFHYRSPDGHNFDEQLESNRCAYTKLNHQQCRRQVVIGAPYCFQHRKMKEHVEVKNSSIPNAGKGLFASDGTNDPHHRVFAAHQTILDYDGLFTTRQALDTKYGIYTAPYAVELTNERVEDASKRRGEGSLINQADAGHVNNVEMIVSPGTREKPYRHTRIRTTRQIFNRDELFLNYGRDYLLHEPGVHFGTDTRKGFHP